MDWGTVNGLDGFFFALAVVGWGAFLAAVRWGLEQREDALSWQREAHRHCDDVGSLSVLHHNALDALERTTQALAASQSRAEAAETLAEVLADELEARRPRLDPQAEEPYDGRESDPAALTDELPAVQVPGADVPHCGESASSGMGSGGASPSLEQQLMDAVDREAS